MLRANGTVCSAVKLAHEKCIVPCANKKVTSLSLCGRIILIHTSMKLADGFWV